MKPATRIQLLRLSFRPAVAPRPTPTRGARIALSAAALCAATLAYSACDKDAPTAAPTVAASAPAAQASAPPPLPPPAKAPAISLEPGAFFVDSERIPSSDADAASRVFSRIDGKPHVENETVTIVAPRAVKPSQVVALVAIVKRAKAVGVTVRTPNRDKVEMPLTITFPTPPVSPCSTVAFISKDARINVWTVGGDVAKSFSKGFAGPDMTLGTEGVRATAARCASPIMFVGADDAMTWGLVYDLAVISRDAPDGAAPLKSSQVGLIPSTTVPGHKVIIE